MSNRMRSALCGDQRLRRNSCDSTRLRVGGCTCTMVRLSPAVYVDDHVTHHGGVSFKRTTGYVVPSGVGNEIRGGGHLQDSPIGILPAGMFLTMVDPLCGQSENRTQTACGGTSQISCGPRPPPGQPLPGGGGVYSSGEYASLVFQLRPWFLSGGATRNVAEVTRDVYLVAPNVGNVSSAHITPLTVGQYRAFGPCPNGGASFSPPVFLPPPTTRQYINRYDYKAAGANTSTFRMKYIASITWYFYLTVASPSVITIDEFRAAMQNGTGRVYVESVATPVTQTGEALWNRMAYNDINQIPPDPPIGFLADADAAAGTITIGGSYGVEAVPSGDEFVYASAGAMDGASTTRAWTQFPAIPELIQNWPQGCPLAHDQLPWSLVDVSRSQIGQNAVLAELVNTVGL